MILPTHSGAGSNFRLTPLPPPPCTKDSSSPSCQQFFVGGQGREGSGGGGEPGIICSKVMCFMSFCSSAFWTLSSYPGDLSFLRAKAGRKLSIGLKSIACIKLHACVLLAHNRQVASDYVHLNRHLLLNMELLNFFYASISFISKYLEEWSSENKVFFFSPCSSFQKKEGLE